jgi:cbb3-type cytochrome oxidase maturation protein
VFILLPLAVVLGGVFLVLFLLAVKGGQFDDLDDPPKRILKD